jgi:hypothetical protein
LMKLPVALSGARVAASRHSTRLAPKAPSLGVGRYYGANPTDPRRSLLQRKNFINRASGRRLLRLRE